MGAIADQMHDLSEIFDGHSETARRNADVAKKAALGGLNPAKRDRLIAGLGAATSDQERCDAVEAMIADCVQERDDLRQDLEERNLLHLFDPTAVNAEIALLQALLSELKQIKIFEGLRDTFRAISQGLEAQGL